MIALNLLLETSNNLEVPVGKVPAIMNLSCFLRNLLSIFGLSYASVASIVKLFSFSVSVKLVPTIFFILDVVVFNKLLLPVISVPLLSVFCFLFISVDNVVKK